MKDFVNVGLLGAGTVGGGVLKVLEKNAEKIAKEVGKPVRITKVLDRHVDRLKQEYGDKYIFTDNADEVFVKKALLSAIGLRIRILILSLSCWAASILPRNLSPEPLPTASMLLLPTRTFWPNSVPSCSRWHMSTTATLCLKPASAAVFLSLDL